MKGSTCGVLSHTESPMKGIDPEKYSGEVP
jgi:hypothetical protein